MQTEFLRIVDESECDRLPKFEKMLMELFKKANNFDRGKLSVIYPDHYKAFQILEKE